MKLGTRELADFIQSKCSGDPADALSAICIITAELLKCAPMPERAKNTYLQYLDVAMQTPNIHFELVPASEQRQ